VNARTTGSILIAALAAVVVFVCLCFRSVPVEAVYPVARAKTVLFRGMRTRVKAWFRTQAAAGENVRLKREVASLALALGDAERLETENARLRRALDYVAKDPERWLAAEVLSEGGAAVGRGRRIRIGKGSLAGVRDGAVVVVPEGLVGRVMSVTPHTAEVALIVDPVVAVSCEIEATDRPKMLGVLSGLEDGNLILRHLRNVAEVPPRSRVLTSGLGGVFPKGLEIGTLQSVRPEKTVRKDAGGLVGEVLPSVDFASLEDVFVRREK